MIGFNEWHQVIVAGVLFGYGFALGLRMLQALDWCCQNLERWIKAKYKNLRDRKNGNA